MLINSVQAPKIYFTRSGNSRREISAIRTECQASDIGALLQNLHSLVQRTYFKEQDSGGSAEFTGRKSEGTPVRAESNWAQLSVKFAALQLPAVGGIQKPDLA